MSWHEGGLSGSGTSGSSDEERLTIAYTESAPKSESTATALSTTDESYTASSSSYTSDTWGTTEGSRPSFALLEELKAKEVLFGYEPVGRSLSLTQGPKLQALDYFWSHSTFQLLNFLMSHLLAHAPDQPVPFLISLLERCLCYRDRGGDPPLLFEDNHVRSLYTALDPMDEGTITYNQYVAAMTTLGLTDFDVIPQDMTRRSEVPKEVFLHEAKKALLDQLDRLLGKGRPLGAHSKDTVDSRISDTETASDEKKSRSDSEDTSEEQGSVIRQSVQI